MKKKIFGVVTLCATLILGACGSGNEAGTDSTSSQENGSQSSADNAIDAFPLVTSNDADLLDGGTLEVAVVMDTQFQGLFQWEFYRFTYRFVCCEMNDSVNFIICEKSVYLFLIFQIEIIKIERFIVDAFYALFHCFFCIR